MQITLEELVYEVKDYLLAPRQIVIETNLLMIIGAAALLLYMFLSTWKYVAGTPRKTKKNYNYYWDNKNKCWIKYDKGQYNQNHTGQDPKWYPTGWYWDEKEKQWKGPDYTQK